MSLKNVTKGFLGKRNRLVSRMSREDIEEYAKSASPAYSILCALGGHVVFETKDKTKKCACCGCLLE